MNELKGAPIQTANGIEERRHDVLLIGRAQKVVGEAASGNPSGDLGVETRRSANGSDPWTYESVVVC